MERDDEVDYLTDWRLGSENGVVFPWTLTYPCLPRAWLKVVGRQPLFRDKWVPKKGRGFTG